MHRALTALIAATLAACSATTVLPSDLAARMAEAPEGAPVRLSLQGNRMVAATVTLGQAAIPAVVRVTIDAVAPVGDIICRGREWSWRGTGYRIERLEVNGGHEQLRSALIADDGSVLERSHSIPLGNVPQRVLATALDIGPTVRRVMIVSGPQREEYWQCTIGDRIGRTFTVLVELDGTLRSVHRQVAAIVEV